MDRAGDGSALPGHPPDRDLRPAQLREHVHAHARDQRGRFIVVGRGENIKSLSYVEHIVEATMHLCGTRKDARRSTSSTTSTSPT